MSDEVTSKDVQEFLTAEAPETNSVNIPADPAVVAEVAGEPEAFQEDKPRVHIPPDPTFDRTQQTLDSSLHWTLTVPGLGKVEPTYSDKQGYIKYLLTDEPVQLPVELTQATAVVRTLTEFEQKVIWEALAQLREKNIIREPAVGMTWMQQMQASLQILEFAGRPLPVLKLPTDDLLKAVQPLIEHVRQNYEPLHTSKWNAMLFCLRIFVAKISLLDENIANESFWLPPS